ncbi:MULTISPECIES: histidine phosphatase family protein [Actinoalloteichus]|uniref:Fructose-2,6-bisphosphatase n=1 Tax=Actinoalloteichus fjordicus TaxID=1612552 RepID=A0AAC9LB33_9PSEU|nr:MULTISPECIES: histidine phosphatase family protein [Actinoalloteichus]APU13094.1 fructose-2,6-bisphosphatase [Actinoalloteichus fjordicus]APU21292.1 fructose-2,6-bisphosphatase [Actinoalloteichus sp. GBA129-24]
MKPTRLTLARHGEAHCNVHGIIGGPRGCTGLTDHGYQQAHQLADRLRIDHAQTPITAAYTTPLRRARETADIIGHSLGLSITTLDDLREPDYGDADGKSWTEVVAAFGRIPAHHPDQPIAPGAEPWSAYLRRANATLCDILHRHTEGTVLIIGHGETVTAAAHLFLNLAASLRANTAFAVHYASITRWEQQPLAWTRPEAGWRWTLLNHNDTTHLTR